MTPKEAAVLNEICKQRNHYADMVAMLQGEIAERDEVIAALHAELGKRPPGEPEAPADAPAKPRKPRKPNGEAVSA